MHYVVADIHGEITKLKNLVKYIISLEDNPEFIFIGDYVDKGEDAKATLDYLIELKDNYSCVFIIGNHEYCWKNASDYEDYLIKYGGINTIKSFNASGLFETQQILLSNYASLFNSFVSYHIEGLFFISHSGIDPLHYDLDLSGNIDEKLFLFNRYQFIKHQALFKQKYKIIFGHTGFFIPYVDDFKIGIDTGACYLQDQPLTSFCIEKEIFYNSDNINYSINSIRGYYCPNIMRNKPYRLYD